MLKSFISKRIFAQWQKPFCTTAVPKPENVSYGDPSMPDRLYKSIELEMKCSDRAVLASYDTFIRMAGEHLDITIGESKVTKPKFKRWTLLKSVHVYRKHLVQYEVRTYYRTMTLYKLTGSTADTFLEYIERMLPEGVALKVTKTSVEPLPSHLSKEEIIKVLTESGSKVEST